MKCQCCPHIETSQLIWTASQLTGLYMRAKLALNEYLTWHSKYITACGINNSMVYYLRQNIQEWTT